MTSGPPTSAAANGERDGYPDVVSTPAKFGAISARALAGSTAQQAARSLPADYDVPRPFAPAPTARYRALQDAYHAALDASIHAPQPTGTATGGQGRATDSPSGVTG